MLSKLCSLLLLVILVLCMTIIEGEQVDEERKAKSSKRARKNLAPDDIFARENACKDKVLWGREHHGGWYTCLDQISKVSESKCLIYSYGLGADWSFDSAAEKFGCEVHGFDPTNLLWNQGMHGEDFSHFNYAKEYPSKSKFFHNWGVGAANSTMYPPGTIPQDWPGLGDPPFSKTNTQPWMMKSIEQTMIELNHINRKMTILKIDVEGAEWDSLTAFFGSSNIQKKINRGEIQQLLGEFHWDPDSL